MLRRAIFFGFDADPDDILALERAAEDVFAQRVFNVLLDGAAQGSCAEIVVGSLIDEELFGFGGQLDAQAMIDACFRSADYFEGRDAFAAKRKPQFKGE